MESQLTVLPQVDNLPEPPRKPYHPPQVTLYGDLAELTQQGPNPLGEIMPLGDPASGGP